MFAVYTTTSHSNYYSFSTYYSTILKRAHAGYNFIVLGSIVEVLADFFIKVVGFFLFGFDILCPTIISPARIHYSEPSETLPISISDQGQGQELSTKGKAAQTQGSSASTKGSTKGKAAQTQGSSASTKGKTIGKAVQTQGDKSAATTKSAKWG